MAGPYVHGYTLEKATAKWDKRQQFMTVQAYLDYVAPAAKRARKKANKQARKAAR